MKASARLIQSGRFWVATSLPLIAMLFVLAPAAGATAIYENSLKSFGKSLKADLGYLSSADLPTSISVTLGFEFADAVAPIVGVLIITPAIPSFSFFDMLDGIGGMNETRSAKERRGASTL